MAGIDEVLERLVTDPEFRAQLHEDAAKALEGYDLDASDLELLAAQVTESMGEGGSVEQRTSKSAMGGLLGSIAEAGFNPQPEPPGAEAMGTAPDTLTPSEGPSPTEAIGRAGFNPQPEPPGHPGNTLHEMGFNPQPEPPAEAETVHAFLKANGSDIQDPGDTLQDMGFNPQPEPPGAPDGDIDGVTLQQFQEVSGPSQASADTPSEKPSPTEAIGRAGFNPQPEPPGAEAMGTAPDTLTPSEEPSPTDAIGRAGFNPQPEPPGHPGDILQETGSNPQPEPPGHGEGIADELGTAEGTASEISNYNLRETFPTHWPGDSPPPEGDLVGESDAGETEVSLTPEWTNFNESDPGQTDKPPIQSDLPEGESRQGPG